MGSSEPIALHTKAFSCFYSGRHFSLNRGFQAQSGMDVAEMSAMVWPLLSHSAIRHVEFSDRFALQIEAFSCLKAPDLTADCYGTL